jgi:hypothetical protein
MVKEQTCGACRFFLASTDDQEQGLCRERPPAALLAPAGHVFAAFPPMTAQGWCGQFQPKENEEK